MLPKKKLMEQIDKLIDEGKETEAKKLIDEQRGYMVQNEIWDIFTRNGATNLNAYTSKDLTAYHAEMPASKLALWMYLMSEMVSDPAFREFYPERDVVLEEQRTSIDNSPTGTLYKKLQSITYKNSPYSWPTIGVKEDVSSFRRDDLKKVYEEHYLPECMVGSIVGDIDIEDRIKICTPWIHRKMGSINEGELKILYSSFG